MGTESVLLIVLGALTLVVTSLGVLYNRRQDRRAEPAPVLKLDVVGKGDERQIRIRVTNESSTAVTIQHVGLTHGDDPDQFLPDQRRVKMLAEEVPRREALEFRLEGHHTETFLWPISVAMSEPLTFVRTDDGTRCVQAQAKMHGEVALMVDQHGNAKDRLRPYFVDPEDPSR